jgi:NAD+ diphosphatase
MATGAYPANVAHDRLAALRIDPDWWAEVVARPGSRGIPVRAGQVLCRPAAGPDATVEPVWIELAGETEVAGAGLGEAYLLGSNAAGEALVALHPTSEAAAERWTAAAGREWRGLRELAALLGADDSGAGHVLQAVALTNWHDSHPRCARCGQVTAVSLAGYQRRCRDCGAEHYPRTDPAVIMTVTDGSDRLLLGRQARWPDGWFSTLAGFVEPGESAEAAVVREVSEEVGLPVAEVHYRDSQPWPFPSSLMLGFAAVVAGAGGEPHPDGTEISEARWFSRPGLLAAVTDGEIRLPPGLSIARRLIETWYGGRLPGGW